MKPSLFYLLYRQRQKQQVSNKDALKLNKNRHDLYAEELVSL